MFYACKQQTGVERFAMLQPGVRERTGEGATLSREVLGLNPNLLSLQATGRTPCHNMPLHVNEYADSVGRKGSLK